MADDRATLMALLLANHGLNADIPTSGLFDTFQEEGTKCRISAFNCLKIPNTNVDSMYQ